MVEFVTYQVLHPNGTRDVVRIPVRQRVIAEVHQVLRTGDAADVSDELVRKNGQEVVVDPVLRI